MKISFVITDMSQHGGMERVTSLLANNLAAMGHEISVVSLIKENESLTYPLDSAVGHHHLLTGVYNRNQNCLKRLATQLKIYSRLRKFFKADDSDAVIAQGFLPALMLWLAGRGARTIVCEHFKYELYSNPLVLKLRNRCYKSLRKVVTLTDVDATKFRGHGIDAATIPNMSTYPVATEIPGSVITSRRILAVGRLEDQKGFDLLIRAVAEFKDELTGWTLDIYGEGSKRDELQAMIAATGCEEMITLKGFSGNIAFSDYAFSAVSSRFEGFSMAILESLANGVPVVSFDCPEGPGVLLAGGTGILVEPENVRALGEAIVKMTKDNALRRSLAQKSLERAKIYSPEAIIALWNKLLNPQTTNA